MSPTLDGARFVTGVHVPASTGHGEINAAATMQIERIRAAILEGKPGSGIGKQGWQLGGTALPVPHAANRRLAEGNLASFPSGRRGLSSSEFSGGESGKVQQFSWNSTNGLR